MTYALNSKTNIPLKFVPPEQYVSTSKVKVESKPVLTTNAAKPKQLVKESNKPKTFPKDLAQMLFNQITGPSFNKNTIALLELVTKENAAEVILEYEKLSKNSLMKDIDNEYGLDINTVRDYVGKKLVEQAKELGINLDGIRSLNKISDFEELNDMLKIISQKIKTCKDSIKKAEKIREENTLSALKKQYPSDKYYIEEKEYKKSDTKTYCVFSKKDNSREKFVIIQNDYISITYYKNNKMIKSYDLIKKQNIKNYQFRMGAENYFEYDEKGKEKSNTAYCYDVDDGTLIDKIIFYDNNYKDVTHESLNSALSLYDTNRYTSLNNQVKNKNYTGDKFDIKFDGYKATIINKTRNQTFELDVSKLFNNKYMKEEDKQAFLHEIKTLPGEVLADLAIECNLIGNRNNMSKEFNEKEYKAIGEYMSHAFNSGGIAYGFHSAMLAMPNRAIITHELGHLMQFCGKDRYHDVSDGTWDADFTKTFESELPNYLKFLETHKDSYRHYCSENEAEFFAETYTYLMLGETGHSEDDVIQKFFPKSYKMVKDRIAEIRRMPLKERNADTENRQKDKAEAPTGILSKIKRSIDSYFSRLTYGSDEYDADLKNKLYKQDTYRQIGGSY